MRYTHKETLEILRRYKVLKAVPYWGDGAPYNIKMAREGVSMDLFDRFLRGRPEFRAHYREIISPGFRPRSRFRRCLDFVTRLAKRLKIW
jgi:hypothetical protein